MATVKAKKQIPAGAFVKGAVVIDGIHINDAWARGLKSRKLIRAGKEDENETSAEDQFYMNFASHPNLAEMNEDDRKAWATKALDACKNAIDPE